MAAIFDVSGTPEAINFGATGYEEIAQNVRMILTTLTGTVPLDRDFPGIESPLDLPIPAAQAKLSAQLYRAIPAHEPRVKVRAIRYEQTVSEAMNGTVIPVVTIEVVE